MDTPLFLFQPLLWSVGFAIGTIMLKRAIESGLGPLRIAFLNNMLVAVLFLPGLLSVPKTLTWSMLEWPLICSLIYALGQLCFFLAMRLGDVTVLAPAMGIKVVFVALFTAVMVGAVAMPWTMWMAALLATLAVFLLSISQWHDRKRLAQTAFLAVMSAGLYGLNDVMLQIHGSVLGAIPFSAVMFSAVAVESLVMIPFFRGSFRSVPPVAMRWGLAGAVICGAQSGGMAYTIAQHGAATAVNIVYSTRGLWSVILVWAASSWFGVREGSVGNAVMGRRLVGGLLLLCAVGLVLASK